MKNECCVNLYKIGKFFHGHGDCGRILFELLGYRFVEYKQSAGFPESALAKVQSKLEEEKISYKVYDKEKLLCEYKGINKRYNDVLDRAYQKVSINVRIEKIKGILEKCSIDDLNCILEMIENEAWK